MIIENNVESSKLESSQDYVEESGLKSIPNFHSKYFVANEIADSPSEGVCFVAIDLAGAAAIRDYIECKCKSLSLSDQAVFEISLIADELVSNAIVATYNQGKKDDVIFRWKIDDTVIKLSVFDVGGGITDLKKMMERKKVQSYSITMPNAGRAMNYTKSGTGLRIVDSLSKEMDVSYYNDRGEASKVYDSEVLGTIITVSYVHSGLN